MAQVEYQPHVTKSPPIPAVTTFLPTGFGVGVGGKGEPLRSHCSVSSPVEGARGPLTYCQEVGKKYFLALWGRKRGGEPKGGVVFTPHCPAKVVAVAHSQVGT